MKLEIRGAEKLSFREKQVVAMKETGRSSSEISQVLGISQSSIATIYNRARTKGYEVVIVIPGEILNISVPEQEDRSDE